MENSSISQLAPEIAIEGTVHISDEFHLFGKVTGEIFARPGSILHIKEGASVEGKIFAEVIYIDGFVKGEIVATHQVIVTTMGRVLGSVKTPSLQVEPGALFQASVKM